MTGPPGFIVAALCGLFFATTVAAFLPSFYTTSLWPTPIQEWAIFAAVFVVATVFIRSYIRPKSSGRAARRSGHCEQCGYDLRATPDRCPECGAVASNANAGERKAAP